MNVFSVHHPLHRVCAVLMLVIIALPAMRARTLMQCNPVADEKLQAMSIDHQSQAAVEDHSCCDRESRGTDDQSSKSPPVKHSSDHPCAAVCHGLCCPTFHVDSQVLPTRIALEFCTNLQPLGDDHPMDWSADPLFSPPKA